MILVLVSFVDMEGDRKYRECEHIYSCSTNQRNNELMEVVSDSGEYMKRFTLDTISALAKYVYGTQDIINYGKYTKLGKKEWIYDTVSHTEFLYTLIKYKDEDILMHIGTGEFFPEVFTTKETPELKPFLHTKLPLFVVEAWAVNKYPWVDKEKKYGQNIVHQFLEDEAVLSVTKGGEVHERNIENDTKQKIDLGNTHGIIYAEDVLRLLEDEAIKKAIQTLEKKERTDTEEAWKNYYYQPIDISDVHKKIHDIQTYSKKDFVQRIKKNKKHFSRSGEVVSLILYGMVNKHCFSDKEKDKLTSEDIKYLYTIIKNFNRTKI